MTASTLRTFPLPPPDEGNPQTRAQNITEATVTLRTVPIDDLLGLYTDLGGANDVAGAQPYDAITDYEIHNYFESDKHKYLCGLTSPLGFFNQSAAVVQLAASTLLWVCDWTAARMGSKPRIPSSTGVDPRWEVLDEWFDCPDPGLAADGVTPLWRVTGTIVFGCLNPDPTLINELTFPRPQWLQPGKLNLRVTSDMLDSTLVRDKP